LIPPDPSSPRLRSDARANIEKLRASALVIFRERGMGVPLEEIAARAGVSTGTLYHRFGSREALIDSVVEELAVAHLQEAVERARLHRDPFARFEHYLVELCALQALFPDLNDVLARRYPGSQRLTELCDGTHTHAVEFADAARDAGQLRHDFTFDDLMIIFVANSAVIAATQESAPDAWRRWLTLSVNGLREDTKRSPEPGISAIGSSSA